MNINRTKKLHNVIKKIIFLLAIIISPYISNSQTCPILDTVILDGFCWDPAGTVGTITINPNDLGPYNYSINGGATIIQDSVFLVDTGTYIIWIQEVASPGCFYVDTIEILEPQDSITVVTSVTSHVLCYGDTTGVAEVNAIGGVLPYTYSWSTLSNSVPYSSDSVVYNLPAGIHIVTVTDSYGCSSQASDSIGNVYPAFIVDLDTIQQVQCFGECNGEVLLNVGGSAPPYTFTWSTGDSYYGPGTDGVDGLCQGGHQVLIQDDYGCDTVVSFIIAEPPQLYAVADVVHPITCYGEDDGEAYAFGIGGTGTSANDYTYSWSSSLSF